MAPGWVDALGGIMESSGSDALLQIFEGLDYGYISKYFVLRGMRLLLTPSVVYVIENAFCLCEVSSRDHNVSMEHLHWRSIGRWVRLLGFRVSYWHRVSLSINRSLPSRLTLDVSTSVSTVCVDFLLSETFRRPRLALRLAATLAAFTTPPWPFDGAREFLLDFAFDFCDDAGFMTVGDKDGVVGDKYRRERTLLMYLTIHVAATLLYVGLIWFLLNF
jgi:hypothetical protein